MMRETTSKINRRHVLTGTVAGVAAALTVGNAAKAANIALTSDEQIQHHAQALLDLIRQELPADADQVAVTVKSLSGRSSVEATAQKRVWREDGAFGGLWVTESRGHWLLKGGLV